MSSRPKTRVAIGTFDRMESLSAALAELSAPDAPRSSVTLVAAPGALGGALEGDAALGRIGGGDGSVAVIRAPGARSTGPGAGEQSALERERIADIGQWIDPRLAAGLERRLADGACLLLAKVANPSDEQFVCRVLIRHAVGQVQVHDLSPQP